MMIETLAIGNAFVLGNCVEHELDGAAAKAAKIARSHPGSSSLGGVGSAAVSASHGVTAALAGHALTAAGYAAYTSVYAYAGHAVSNLAAYEDEHAWQIDILRELAN